MLLGEVGRQLVRLAEEEVDLARAELASDARSAGWTVIGFGLALVAGLVGLNLLFVAVVLALGQVMPGWLAALIAAVGVLVGAYWPHTRDGRIVRGRRWPSPGNR